MHTNLVLQNKLRSKQKHQSKDKSPQTNINQFVDDILSKTLQSNFISTSKLNYKVILTGGYSKLFKKHISKKSVIDNDITTKGIIKVYKDLLL